MWSIGILVLSRTIQDAFYRRHFRKRCLGELRRTPCLRTSGNSLKANFRESPKGEVRRIHILGGWVNTRTRKKLRRRAQPTALFTSSPILASSAAPNSLSAKEAGHM